MADFKIAHKRTSVFEGGYANDPSDRGGETWKGIARNMFPKWQGWSIIDGYKYKPGFPRNLNGDVMLQGMVDAFYEVNFWDRINGDNIDDQESANNIYDSAVNIGVGGAIKMVQRSLSLPETGRMDAATLNKLNGKE